MFRTSRTNCGSELRHHSKIAMLAEETLAHIFTLGAETGPQHPDAFKDATTFPVIVSHVCRGWRRVALCTSRLWGKVFVCRTFELPDVAESGDGSSRSTSLTEATCLPRIQAFLERSRRSPLSVHVDIRSPDWYYRPNERRNLFTARHMTVLLDRILPHIDRLEELEIISDAWDSFSTLLERCGSSDERDTVLVAKSLRRFALIRTNAYAALEAQAPPSFKTPISPFENAPALRCLELAGVHINWNRHNLCNLTELSLKYHARSALPTAAQLVDIISSSPRMESLSLHGWGVESFGEGSDRLEGQLSFKNIKRLSIGWIDAHYCRRLLSLFSWHLPKLESFTLEDVRNSLDPLSIQDSSCVLDYIALRSVEDNVGCRAQTAFDVVLNSVCASLDSLHQLMEALPLTRSLTLHNVSDELVSILGALQDPEAEAFPFSDLSHVIVRTASGKALAKTQQIARDLATLSTRHITIELEDLLESDTETTLFEEDSLEDGGVLFSGNEFSSFVGEELWLDPAADGEGNQEGILHVAPPYISHDCVYDKSVDLSDFNPLL